MRQLHQNQYWCSHKQRDGQQLSEVALIRPHHVELSAKLLLLVLVVLLHALGMHWMQKNLSTPRLAPRANPQALSLSVVEYQRIEADAPEAKKTTTVNDHSAARATGTDTERPATAVRLTAPSVSETPERLAGFSTQTYFEAQDLDTRARPVIDWVIATGALPPRGGISLFVKVWVAADGNIDHFELANADEVPDWAERVLSPLAQTAMEPATRNGAPVASTMMVELIIEPSFLLP